MKNPDSRRERLLVQEVGTEWVIYDQDRHRVHRLNRAAALVWRNCDGVNTVSDLAALLRNELTPDANEEWVWQALGRLGKARLLKEPVARPGGAGGVTRRRVLRAMSGTTALLALLPVVSTMLTPSPVRADDPCTTNQTCIFHCMDLCKTNADCHSDAPFCVAAGCTVAPACASCQQKTCQKHLTPS
jgi:hypothetical protein